MGKQATPRNVQRYTSGFNAVTDRFLEHIKSTRGDDGTISDVTISMQRLLTEGMFIMMFIMSIHVVHFIHL